MAKKAATKPATKKPAAKNAADATKTPPGKSPLETEIEELETKLASKKKELAKSAGGLPPVAPKAPGEFAPELSW